MTRGYIRIRTPDDGPDDWTAQGDLIPGQPYTYVSGDVAVLVDWAPPPVDMSGPPPEPEWDLHGIEPATSGGVVVWVGLALLLAGVLVLAVLVWTR